MKRTYICNYLGQANEFEMKQAIRSFRRLIR
jgi:hypothetical protein